MLTLALVCFSTVVNAQSKEEKRQQKQEMKRLKKMKPEQIQGLMSNLERKNDDIKGCNKEKEELQVIIQNHMLDIQELQSKVDSLDKGLIATSASPKADSNATFSWNQAPKTGIYFRIQLGAYGTYNSKNFNKVEVEKEMDQGLNKYVVGVFGTLKAAEAVRNDIVKLGIKDAWVVSYKDGVRISKEEATGISMNY